MLVDTHVHIESGVDVAGMVSRAAAAGVTRLVAVGGSPAMNAAALDAAQRFPGRVFAATGFDRHAVDDGGAGIGSEGRPVCPPRSSQAARTEPGPPEANPAQGVVAIGEIGLDYHYTPETAPAQRELLEAQLGQAREAGLPVIVHSREAEADTLDALRRHREAWSHDPDRIGVLHCYTGTAPFARALVELGYCISFSGILTFRNADPLRAVAAGLPGEALLVETDTPYLAPVPHRGQPNEPAFLPHVDEALAAARHTTVEQVAALTTANATRLFGLG